MERRSIFIFNWTVGTVVGWILALLTAFTVIGLGWELFIQLSERVFHVSFPMWVDDILFGLLLLFSLGLMGLSLGLAQWQLALIGRINKWAWIAVSIVTVFTSLGCLMVATMVSPQMLTSYGGVASGMDIGYEIRETWPISVSILGIALGLAIGLPQWIVLHRYVHRAGWWILANIVGGVAAFASLIVAVYINASAIFSTSIACCTGPVLFGAITGAVLFSLLQRPRQTR